MKKLVTILFLLMILKGWGQTHSLKIADVSSCMNEATELAIQGVNMNNIGAITLFITYNPQELIFDTLTAIHSQLNGLIYNQLIQNDTGIVIISWSGFTPANMNNDDLCILHFQYLGQESILSFSADCELADYNANILQVSYESGSIENESEPVILVEPEDQAVPLHSMVSIEISCDYVNSYQWEYKKNGDWLPFNDNGNTTGSHTSELTYSSDDPSGESDTLRCQLYGCIQSQSNEIVIAYLWEIEKIDSKNWETFPNPATDYLWVTSTMNQNGSWHLFDSKGQKMGKGIFSDKTFKIPLMKYEAGLYFLHIFTGEESLTKKIIVNHSSR